MTIDYKANARISMQQFIAFANSTRFKQYHPLDKSKEQKLGYFLSNKLRVNRLCRNLLVCCFALAGFDSSELHASAPKKNNIANDIAPATNNQQEEQAIILVTNPDSHQETPNDLAEKIAENKKLKEISEQKTKELSKQMENIEEKNKHLEENIRLQNQQIELLKEKIRLLSNEKN